MEFFARAFVEGLGIGLGWAAMQRVIHSIFCRFDTNDDGGLNG